jgi:predicted Zn-dependent peptidase
MAMESDRIKNPVLREFYKERSVVMEERRLRVDNSPQGKLWEGFLATAYMAHPYGRPIVGWESDISRVTRQDALDFFKRHYDVSRLVVGIVGGVKADTMETLLRRYFEPIASQPDPRPERISVEPEQHGERRVNVEFDAEPSVMMGFHRPDMHDKDDAVFDVVAELLGTGRTSRFYKSVIQKNQIGVSAWAEGSSPGERAPSLFVVGGTPRAPHTAPELEEALLAEVDRLKTEGPTPEELEKVKNSWEANMIRTLSSNDGLADQLAYFESVGGNWRQLIDQIDAVRAVSAEDVRRVMSQYLTPSNRTVAVLVRPQAKKMEGKE